MTRLYLPISSNLFSLINSTDEQFDIYISEHEIAFSTINGTTKMFSPFSEGEEFQFAADFAQELNYTSNFSERLKSFCVVSKFNCACNPDVFDCVIPIGMPVELEWINAFFKNNNDEFEIQILSSKIILEVIGKVITRYEYPVSGFTPFEAFVYITEYLQGASASIKISLKE